VFTFILLIVTLAISAQSLFSLYLMLYSWEYPPLVKGEMYTAIAKDMAGVRTKIKRIR
jgi:hypothetical protein